MATAHVVLLPFSFTKLYSLEVGSWESFVLLWCLFFLILHAQKSSSEAEHRARATMKLEAVAGIDCMAVAAFDCFAAWVC